jgi:hypothetical protein
MGKKQSFLSKDELTPRGKLMRHLNIVISEQDSEGYYLIVPVTTYRDAIHSPTHEQNNDSCILEAGSHSFLNRKSWVCFSRAKQMTYIEIFNGIHKGLLISKEDVQADVLRHIQDHAKTSKYLPGKFAHFEEYF